MMKLELVEERTVRRNVNGQLETSVEYTGYRIMDDNGKEVGSAGVGVSHFGLNLHGISVTEEQLTALLNTLDNG